VPSLTPPDGRHADALTHAARARDVEAHLEPLGCSAPDLDPGGHVFFFFSNRLGCLGSLLVSLVLTLVLIAVLTLIF
jgi:hypothetical protein